MSAANFHIQEHLVPCQHMREYARGTVNDDEDEIKLAVKQYTPRDNPTPRRGDITIVAAHANGVVKELYEPFWDDLYEYSRRTGAFRIRAIWMADAAHQGVSGIVNEGKLGNDPSWFDYPRDLYNMINVLRKHMVRPLVGLGHSFGAAGIVKLSLMHPRLLSGAILLDPVIQRAPTSQGNYFPAYMSTFRRDVWPTREYAASTFRQNAFYQGWDPRVLQKHIEHGLRALPTALHPSYEPRPVKPGKPAEPEPKDPVTLSTTKHQEVLTFLRGNFPAFPADQPPSEALAAHTPPRRTHPDIPALEGVSVAPFYRAEPMSVFSDLPRVRPRCLYIFGGDSVVSPPEACEEKMRLTGTGEGGSGGRDAEQAVQSATVDNAGHFVTFEKPTVTAEHAGRWLGAETKRWQAEAEREQREWAAIKNSKGGLGRMMMTDDFVAWVKYEGELRTDEVRKEEEAKTAAKPKI